MNPDSFINRLPPEVQNIFDELTGVYLSTLSGEAMDRAIEKYYEELVEYDKRAGNPEHYHLPDAEFQRWVATTKPVHEQTIVDLEAKGLPANTIYQEALRLMEEYSK